MASLLSHTLLIKYFLSLKELIIKNQETFPTVHRVISILYYIVLYNFFALVFALVRVRKHRWDDITQGKQ